MLYPYTRSIRGLLTRIKKLPEWMPHGRQLMDFHEFSQTGRKRGQCQWCKQPTEPAKLWHKDCAIAYRIAAGNINHASGRDFKSGWKRCAICNAGKSISKIEIDHVLALSIAVEHKKAGCRKWWKAWTLNNLRPLCRQCHVAKTKSDRQLLAHLQKQRDNELLQRN